MARKWITTGLLVLSLSLSVWAQGDPSLMGWWKMDEGAGPIAADSSGGNRHGVLHGNPRWVEGVLGSALDLDGNGDYVDCGSDPNLIALPEVTVVGWIKVEASNRDQKIVATGDGRAGGFKFGLYSNNKLELEIRAANNQYAINRNVAGGTALAVDTWVHVAGVSARGQYLRTYVDGALDRELRTSVLMAPTTGRLSIGSWIAANGYYFNGVVDDMQVYGRALSAAEIERLATLGGGSNDECAHATPIGEVINQPFDTREATYDGQGRCMRSPNIWYCYTASCTGIATVSLCSSQYDTMLAVYKGCICDQDVSRLLGCNDDFCGLQSELSIQVVAGDSYLIEIGGYGNRTGEGVLTITCEGEQAGDFDLGDAPDSTNDLHIPMTAYIPTYGPAVKGNFPTTFLGNGGTDAQGPLHHQPRATAHLGERVSLETEAYKGPDEDPENNIDLWLSIS
ncbi:LamG domain-containing protein, partial [Planctomycetota bacterium]